MLTIISCEHPSTSTGTIILVLLVLLTNITSFPTCPGTCSLCEKNSKGEVVKVTCQNIPPQILPGTVVELHLSDATGKTIPLGILRSFYLAHKSDLQVLSIQRYGIKKLQAAFQSCCPSLTQLDLSNNLMQDISDGTFQNQHKLVYLNLNNNQLPHVSPQSFSGLVALLELDLSQNKITAIPKETFTSLANLTKLDLESNLISHIEAEAFKGLISIESINLADNQLTVIQADVFPNLHQLRSINLQNNRLETLNPLAMYGVSLELLNFAQNNFTMLPSQLIAKISNIKLEINMARNMITEIHNGDLQNVNLKVLYLAANMINLIQPEAFKDSFIQKLDLEQNQLTSLPGQLQLTMNQSNHWLLSNNPWSCDCDIQWLASYLNTNWQANVSTNNSQDPVCATPTNLLGWPIRLIVNDLQVSCNNQASIPYPTRGLPVPPKQDVITPSLRSSLTGKKSKIAIIVTLSVLLAAILVVAVVIVTRYMYKSRSRIGPDAEACKKPDINFRPRFSQWSLTETLQA